MTKTIQTYILFLGLLIFFPACDSVNQSENSSNNARILNIQVAPDGFSFTPADGVKDTTVTFTISITASDTSFSPELFVTNDATGTEIVNEILDPTSANTFSREISITTSTTSIAEYTATVLLPNQVYAQTGFFTEGFAGSPPQILEISNPETVSIPSSGSTAVPFRAKVTDPDGQSGITAVYLNFLNPDGSLLSDTPFQLLDDGNSGNTSGDTAAGDSVYTITFSVDETNTPASRTALYWSIDNSGLSSDTLTNPFNIVE